MSEFPDPIYLPNSVGTARKSRKKELKRSIHRGILIRSLIIAMELGGFAYFSSYALLIDALSSILDVITSFFLWICIYLASRPPDEEHPFGHGRFEPFAGLQLGVFMVLVGLVMSGQQGFILFTEISTPPLHPTAWVISLVAVLLLEGTYQVMMRIAKKNHSSALAADAMHFRIDAINSLLATIALVLGAFLPKWSHTLDHIGAVLIAFLMVVVGFFAIRENFHQLMDKIPDEKFFERVRQAARSVAGVCETEKLNIQLMGPDAHVDIDIEVDPSLTVEKAHRISQEVRATIQTAWPSVRDVIVHLEPYYPNDH